MLDERAATSASATSSEAAEHTPRSPSILVPVLKRIGWGVVTLWAVSLITFALLFIVPRFGRTRFVKAEDAAKANDPTTMMAMTIAGARSNPQTIADIKRERGLDKPLFFNPRAARTSGNPGQIFDAQYPRFVHDALTNNLKSYRNDDRVMAAIWRRFPNTLLLALTALAVYLLASIPLGILTARHDGGAIDRTALFVGLLAISVPTFWLGRLLQQYLGYRWGVFSVGGGASLGNLVLPAMTLGVGGAALYARLLHTNLRGVLGQDYIRAARARGLAERLVMSRHALRNALIPLVTILGIDFASLLSGLIFTEKIFAWPGIGSLVVDSVFNADAPMIMGTVLFCSLMVIVMSIVVDLAYRVIDPRVRFE